MLIYHLNHQLPNNQSPFSSPEGFTVSSTGIYRNNASTIDSAKEVFVSIVLSVRFVFSEAGECCWWENDRDNLCRLHTSQKYRNRARWAVKHSFIRGYAKVGPVWAPWNWTVHPVQRYYQTTGINMDGQRVPSPRPPPDRCDVPACDVNYITN